MEMNKEIKDILKQLSLVKSEVGSKHLVSRLADLVEESDANVRCIIEDGECVDVLLRLWDLGILKVRVNVGALATKAGLHSGM